MNTRQKTIRYSLAGVSLASFLGVFGYIASTDHTKPLEAAAAPSNAVQPAAPPVASSSSAPDTPMYGRHERRFRLPDDSGQQVPSQSSGSTQPYGGTQSNGSTQQSQAQPQAPQTHTRSRAS